MDIHQTVVISVAHAMTALDRILRRLAPLEQNSLSTSEGFRRLVAFELLASPELTSFNHVMCASSGQTFVEQPTSSPHRFARPPGVLVLRAPLLDTLPLMLQDHATTESVALALAARHAQTRCCWYSASKKKACPADAVRLSQQDDPFVFCRKHWSPILRHNIGTDADRAIVRSSEANLDDWLQSIV